MSINSECHDTIVGITRKSINIDGYDPEYSVSKSDLFLDELQGIVLNEQCDLLLWEMTLRSRQKAWQQFRNDLAVQMEKYAENVRQNKNCDLGDKNFLSKASVNTWSGVRLYSSLVGVSAVIKSISLFPAMTGNVDIKVIDDNGAELLSTTVAVTTKKEYKYNIAGGLEVPLSGNLLIIATSNGEVYSQKLGCCGSTASYFDVDRPTYNDRDSRIWRRWIMASGVSGANPDINSLQLRKGSSYGISVNMTFKCDDYPMLCSDDSDFVADKTDRAIAFALLYAWGEHFLAEVSGTGQINRYVLLGFDAINNNVAYYKERYNEMIKYIASTIDYTRTECWVCGQKVKINNRFGIK
jgi:hypothetical protein